MQILALNQWEEAGEPCDFNGEKLEEAEEEGTMGKPVVSTDLDA